MAERLISAIIGLGLLGGAQAATAQGQSVDAQYAAYHPADDAIVGARSAAFRSCIDRSGGVTVELRSSSHDEYERLDAQLNRNYRQLMSRIGRSHQQALLASQRRWLRNRWQSCENRPEYEGGTMDLIIRDSCILDELTRRTLWLEQLRLPR